MPRIELILGDCLDKLQGIPDGSVDAVLCDLPYGTLQRNHKWDIVIPFVPMWEQLLRVTKLSAPIALFGSNPFAAALIMSNLAMFKYEWIWDKVIPGGMSLATYQPMRQHEHILVFGKARPNFYPIKTLRDKPISGYNTGNTITGEAATDKTRRVQTMKNPTSIIAERKLYGPDKPLHPTQKPLALMEYLVRTYTNEGDTVLDFAAGVFTTALACLNLGRSCIAIEKEESYFALGVKRINDAVASDESHFAQVEIVIK